MVLPSRVVGLAMRAERKVIDHRRFEVSQLTDCTAVCFGHGGGFVPAILITFLPAAKTWISGRSGAKTRLALLPGHDEDQCADPPQVEITPM
jgi:hypothetical protein